MAGDDPTARTEHLDILGSEDAGPPRRRIGRRALTAVVAAVAAVALVAAGAFGAVLASGSDQLDGFGPAASSSSPEPDPSVTADREVFRHHGHGPRLRSGHGLGLGGAPLHGELVVPDPDGDGYRTMVVQRGEVTSASGSSLTVRSEDGFSATYRLTDDTMYLGGVDGASSLEDGDQVHVAGVRGGGTVSAVHVADISRIHERFGDLRDRMR